jgi:rhomboid protease GluP
VDELGTGSAGAEVFRGSRASCLEYALVLEAKGLGYECIAAAGAWALIVAPALRDIATEELRRYAAERTERTERHDAPGHFLAFAGGGMGAAVYAFILILVAYCAGAGSLGVDWLSAGAIQSGAGLSGDWWRPVTALTLHVDQEHLMGNLVFGIAIGTLAGRMFGPGVAWLSILLSGATGNTLDMLASPAGQRAVGASTAVFAALGLLAGYGWGHTGQSLGRRFYRWAPLFGGVCLLILLGSGNPAQHIDVLGHLLGFLSGTGLGWVFARVGMPRREALLQWMTAAAALALIGVAWTAALLAFR